MSMNDQIDVEFIAERLRLLIALLVARSRSFLQSRGYVIVNRFPRRLYEAFSGVDGTIFLNYCGRHEDPAQN